jgi:hypothetical protein
VDPLNAPDRYLVAYKETFAMNRLAVFILAVSTGFAVQSPAQEPFPTATISNGELAAVLALPDAAHGYYRGTRFDWSGIVTSLRYKGHEFITPWSEINDPEVADYEIRDDKIATGTNTTMVGIPEEFASTTRTALGWEDAAVGGTFIKIGVGELRKSDAKPYDHFRLYEIAQGTRWKVGRRATSVTFVQAIRNSASGYGYVYTKTVSLVPGKPQLKIEHVLRNTGGKPIAGLVFDHNFTRWDNATPGPDYSMHFAFDVQPAEPIGDKPVAVTARSVTFTRALQGRESMRVLVKGFGVDAKDYDFGFENSRLRMGLRVTGDQPLTQAVIWSNRAVFAIEPFISYDIAPGTEHRWNYTYEAFELGAR